jgi:hypothetical protein
VTPDLSPIDPSALAAGEPQTDIALARPRVCIGMSDRPVWHLRYTPRKPLPPVVDTATGKIREVA